jgi:hypothetical protein
MASAQAAPASSGTAPQAAASAPSTPTGPAPRGKVVNIGMHIGGGPNDDATKEPIRRSVEPHFEALRRCYALAPEGEKGDYGIDLRIEREGGLAKASHPRTAIKDKGFQACVLHVFEEIQFLKPRTGTTVVSYSLRFSPLRWRIESYPRCRLAAGSFAHALRPSPRSAFPARCWPGRDVLLTAPAPCSW